MNKTTRPFSRSLKRGESGQAFLEFAFVAMMMIIMLFALIDFGRFIYERQVMVNLSREGANLAARAASGSTPAEALSNAVNAVINSAAPLNLISKGRVIISAVLNDDGTYRVTSQYARGSLSVISKVRNGVGAPATMPVAAVSIPQPNQTVFVAEVYYSFTPITPVGKLLQTTFPPNLYDAAYF